MSIYQEILYEVVDPVATITLNRPEKLNAISVRMQRELKHALADAERRPDVVGIVLTGAGRGFTAGADMGLLQEIAQQGGLDIPERSGEQVPAIEPGDPSLGPGFEHTVTYLARVRKPVIAAVNGACAGLGFALALFCDLRFVGETAFFMSAFPQRGLVAEQGTSWILPRLIGPARALDVMWSSRRISGPEAFALGIANRVLPGESLVPEAQAYVRTLAQTVSPGSLMHMKRQIWRQLSLPLEDSMRETDALVGESVGWPEFREGLSAFLERRSPRFPRVTVE